MDVASEKLDGNADAVEFCPHRPFHHVLAVATYTLEEGDPVPNRSGSISLFSSRADGALELLHRVETVGVFDIKWNPGGSGGDGSVRPLLAQANAAGYLALYSLQSDGRASKSHGIALTEVCEEKLTCSMCLCVDWHPSAESISVGLSSGSVAVVRRRESKLEQLQSWAAHEYEVWATSFDSHRPQLLYTGSDDCCFSCWDVREAPSKAVFKDAKTHKMGVCCIAPSPIDSNMLLTGSYDEFLRVWDVRSTSKPVNQKFLSLGGGVWRIKHHPYVSGLVLAACMHNGFAIVTIEGDSPSVVETYDKHASLAYGADWQRGDPCMEIGNNRGMLVATCSFYDQLLRIWKPDNAVARQLQYRK